MTVGGTGDGIAQDATIQQMIKLLGVPTPSGGTGQGLAQDASLQALLAAISGGGTGGVISVANIAALAALVTGSFVKGTIAYVQSPKSYWNLDPTSTATPDGASVVAATGGGNWLLGNAAGAEPSISLLALGCKFDNATDDAPAFQAAVNAFAGTGVRLVCPANQTALFAASNVTLPPRTLIDGYGSTIRTTVGNIGVITGTIFTTQSPFFSGTSLVALFSDATPGLDTIQVTTLVGSAGGNIAAGTNIVLRNNNRLRGSQYIVQSVAANGGHFTVTLDRTVLRLYTAVSSTVEVCQTLVDGIEVRGLHFTGVSTQYVEIEAAWYPRFRDCTFDTSGGAWVNFFALTSDGFCVGTFLENCTVDGGGVAALGLGCEQTEQSLYTHCLVKNVTSQGFAVISSTACDFVACSTSQCGTYGIALTTNGSSPIDGCLSCAITGGTHSGDGIGLGIGNGSTKNVILGVAADYCGRGFEVDAISGATSDCTLIGCSALGARILGFSLLGGAGGTLTSIRFIGCVSDGAAGAGFQADATAGPILNPYWDACKAINTTGNGMGFAGGASITGATFGTLEFGSNQADLATNANEIHGDRLVCTGLSGTVSQAVVNFSGAEASVNELLLTCSQAPAGVAAYFINTGRVYIGGGFIKSTVLGGLNIGIELDNAGQHVQLSIENFRLVATTAITTGIAGLSNDVVRVGDNVNLDAAGTPINMFGVGFQNVSPAAGQALAIGANTIAFPDVKTTERLILTQRGAGLFTVGAATPGAGFAVTSTTVVTVDWSIR